VSLPATWKVTLNKWEVRICTWLSKNRYESARKGGVTDAQMGPQASEETDRIGICGEFAFCKVFNLYPDMTIGPRKGGVDAWINGMAIDVKTTTCAHGRLLATTKKADRACDVYALVIGEPPTFTMAGWAHSYELLRAENLVNLGYGPGYALHRQRLHPMDQLLTTTAHEVTP
jgi:hypothetical protein